MAKARLTENPPCVISKDLWKIWKASKGKGDVEEIMKLAQKAKLPCSKPVITQSILYGFCNNDSLRRLITKYFVEKVANEKEIDKEEQKQIDLLKKLKSK